MTKQKILFSIVTVCFNAADTIEKTMASVLSQNDRCYEYIIMDGGSTDGTVEKIRGMIACTETPILFFSEPDTGLYNAMNKAAHKCSGEYVIFMNSGDTFYHEDVLQKAAEWIEKQETKADLYYGDVERIYENRREIERYPGKHTIMKLLLMGKMPCHQSIFTKTGIMCKYGFDESYTITADYNFLMECKKQKHTMEYLPMMISCSECVDGISSQKRNLDQMREQDDRSLRTYFPVWYFLLKPVKFLKRKLLG